MRATATLALALAISAASMGGAFADDKPGPDWLPAEQVRQKLLASGYTEITELEVHDGHWDGKGVKDGKRMTFDADPRTGAIIGEMADE